MTAPVPSADVSRETRALLDQYHQLLLKWQKAVNLVSPSTIDEAWTRHFEDSMQLAALLPPTTKTLFDFGSGAGFPGLVLALMRPDIAVHLVESDQKKCSFLSTVSRETKIPVSVHNCRIEALQTDAVPDVISARALASLSKLFAYARPWALKNPDLVLLLPKGENFEVEVKELERGAYAQCEEFVSKTSENARILRFSGIYNDVHKV
ncbi:MAG: 16S rRNA (guanine(527)-N(7))-methyltransferase RsmG [Micavibrio sp.]